MAKVTGITKSGYVMELTISELDRLCNATSSRYQPELSYVGKEFEILDAWSNLLQLRMKQEELEKMSARLRAVADLLHPIACEVIEATTPPEPAKAVEDDDDDWDG